VGKGVPKHLVIFPRMTLESHVRHKGSSLHGISVSFRHIQTLWVGWHEKSPAETARLGSLDSAVSVHGGDTGNAPTLAVDHLLGFQEFVEGNKPHGVAALVQLIVV